jgi:outer membrane murein-binding lipoprotein Lpp
MSLPVGISTVTVSGTYTHPDGTPMRGTVSLAPHPGKIVAAAGGTVVQGPVTQALDAAGAFTMTVVATDSPGINPSGFTYDVRIAFTDAGGDTFPISLPGAAPAVSLPALTPAESPSSGTYLIVNLVQSVNTKTGTVVLGPTDVGADASGAATSAVTAHAGASDPHGDRAWATAAFYPMAYGNNLNSYVSDAQTRIASLESRMSAAEAETQAASKTADESVTSSTALHDDAHLFLAVDSGGWYAVESYLAVIGDPAADISLGWSAPAGSVLRWTECGPVAANSDNGTSVRLDLLDLATPATVGIIPGGTSVAPRGVLQVGGTAGTFRLRWAQSASSATPTTIKSGSWIKLTRIA